MIYGIKTTIGQEKIIVDLLLHKQKQENAQIYSLSIIDNLRGYILAEADNETEVRKLIYKVPHIKGLVKGEIKLEEIEHFLESKPMTAEIERGMIVEITSGAFKGEKAKVIRVDQNKDKITVEIIEAAVPIPITVNASNIRVVTDVTDVKKE